MTTPASPSGRREWEDPEHSRHFLERRSRLGRIGDGEEVLDECLPTQVLRILDLGTGDGRLICVVRRRRPEAQIVGVDASPAMLAAARARFLGDPNVDIRDHDLGDPLPEWGPFDAVVSAFAIHHLEDARKRDLFAEIFSVLTANGMFANLEHVSSPTERLHREFLAAIGNAHGQEDASNRCASVADQLSWLAATGFTDVDCAWKWREMALLVARRSSGPA